MATIQEHNEIIKIVFDGNKHLKHVLDDEQIRNMTMVEARFPLSKLPVCGSCERLGLWGKAGQCYCKVCGTVTKTPITYSSYLASGYDVDATGQTFRSIAHQAEMEKREIILPNYGF